jgi:hypothetical protein
MHIGIKKKKKKKNNSQSSLSPASVLLWGDSNSPLSKLTACFSSEKHSFA